MKSPGDSPRTGWKRGTRTISKRCSATSLTTWYSALPWPRRYAQAATGSPWQGGASRLLGRRPAPVARSAFRDRVALRGCADAGHQLPEPGRRPGERGPGLRRSTCRRGARHRSGPFRRAGPAARSTPASAARLRVIGMLGGMSWESTAEYYRLANELVRERLAGCTRHG